MEPEQMQGQLVDYKALYSDNFIELQQAVKSHLLSGWELYGYLTADGVLSIQVVVKRELPEELGCHAGEVPEGYYD